MWSPRADSRDRISAGPGSGLLFAGGSETILAGRHLRDVQRALVGHLEPGDTFVDHGAREGLFTLIAARAVGPSGAVIAVEADPARSAAIEARARDNGFEHVTVIAALDLPPGRAILLTRGGVPEGFAEREQIGDHRIAGRDVPEIGDHRKSDPMVTSVIPTYNRNGRVQRAVRSVLAQTHAPHEVIVVDDGSTDGTAAALRETFGDAIRVLEKENGGVSAARNYGAEHARGDLVAFLDSDDTWEPDKNQRQVDYLLKHPDCALVLTDFVEVDERGRHVGRIFRRTALPDDGAILPHVLRDPTLQPSTMMVWRDVFLARRGFDVSLRTAEDLDLHLRIALCHHVGLIAEPLVTYEVEGDDRLSELSCSYDDDVYVIERFVFTHYDAITERDRRAGLFNAYQRVAAGMLHQQNYAEAARFARLAAQHADDQEDAKRVLRLVWMATRHAAARMVRALRS